MIPKLTTAVCIIGIGMTVGTPDQAHVGDGPIPDSTERARATHVLSRLTYGPRPGDVDRVLGIGIEQFVAAQLDPTSIPNDRLDARLGAFALLRTTSADLAQIAAEQRRLRRTRQTMMDSSGAGPSAANPSNALRRYVGEFQQLAVLRAVLSERQLQEVMVDFWANHFNVFMGKGRVRTLAPDYIEHVIRPNAMGRFEDLLVATAQAPAMLVYLDNVQSVAEGSVPPQLARLERALQRQARRGRAVNRQSDQPGPAERLAQLRERLPTGRNENYARELLELHTIGVDGGYSQQDIEAVANILTGWSVHPQTQHFQFNDWAHDRGAKIVMGNSFPANRGVEEGIRLLQWLSDHPSTRRHVSAKLCTRFVADEPPPDCIDLASEAWAATGGDIPSVLRAIIGSDAFWADEHRGTKIKTPLEFVVSSVRAMDAAPDTTQRLAQVVRRLGQPLYGHEAPTGYPETKDEWVNAGALMGRVNIALGFAQGHVPGVDSDLESVFPPRVSRADMIAQVNETILGGMAAPATLAVMEEQTRDIPDARIRRILLVGLALGSPEFQRQ